MPQHIRYDDPAPGYYYFRPYHYSHIARHQEFASRHGVDARNPYDLSFIKEIELQIVGEDRDDRRPNMEGAAVEFLPPGNGVSGDDRLGRSGARQ